MASFVGHIRDLRQAVLRLIERSYEVTENSNTFYWLLLLFEKNRSSPVGTIAQALSAVGRKNFT